MARGFLLVAVFGGVMFATVSAAPASDHRVRLYEGTEPHGAAHHDVVIHRIYRPRYDANDYRRVPRRDAASERRGTNVATLPRSDAASETEQTDARSGEDYWRHHHHNPWRTRDRVIILIIDQSGEVVPAPKSPLERPETGASHSDRQ